MLGVFSQLSYCSFSASSDRQYNRDATKTTAHCSRSPLGLAFIHIVEQSYSISYNTETTKMNMASTVNRKITAHIKPQLPRLRAPIILFLLSFLLFFFFSFVF